MQALFKTLLVLAVVALPLQAAAGEAPYLKARLEMVGDQIKERGVSDARVLTAMRRVPRHLFVPPSQIGAAYRDRPLSIGYGQTISQPYIVAFMTEVLKLTGREKVLEIGTGSGYQAAILAETTGPVFSIEIIPELHQSAKERLARLGYKKVRTMAGDGYFGWPDKAPFDGIIVTCAAGHIPPPLIGQLKPGGRMVIPVGGPWSVQSLVLAEKDEGGRVRTRALMYVRFVPLVRRK